MAMLLPMVMPLPMDTMEDTVLATMEDMLLVIHTTFTSITINNLQHQQQLQHPLWKKWLQQKGEKLQRQNQQRQQKKIVIKILRS